MRVQMTDLDPYITAIHCHTTGCTYTCRTLEELEAHLREVHV
jgi:hypothetical protein